LGDVEAADARQWPPVTIAAYQATDTAPVVLLEVGASAPPIYLEPAQARRVSTALLDAAAVVEEARSGQ